MAQGEARARKRAIVPRSSGINLLTDEWIEEVAQTEDNELRAHRITLTYSHLAHHLDELIHGPERTRGPRQSLAEAACNANWFHFATWANRTVTYNIGAERAPPPVHSGLATPLRRRLTPAVLQPQASQGQRVGRALAWGQRLIFVATCLTLLEFSDHRSGKTVFRDVKPAKCKRAAKITELTTWGDRKWFTTERHFEPIWRAFERYELACDATPAARARLVLGANVLLMAVDQDLIDPALRIVVDQAPQRLTGAIDWRVAKLVERLRGVAPQLAYVLLQSRHDNERRTLDTVWSRLLTDQVLVLALPTETLRVGRDIPARHRQWPYFPPQLRDLDAGTEDEDQEIAAALVDVARHVDSLDRTAGQGRGSAARDWRRWDERMNWILTLLRSRQQDDTLFWSPYSPRDAQRIINGELPLQSADPSGRVQPPIGLGVFPTETARARDSQ